MIRFDRETNVAGYDPDKYLEMYENAEGGTPEEKIASLRQNLNSQNREKINAQKRAAYAAKKQRETGETVREYKKIAVRATRGDVTKEYTKYAQPGVGRIEYDKTYNTAHHKEEIKVAQWLHDNQGGDIVLLQESGELYKKTPDFLWNGKQWELKTVTTEKSADSAVRSAIKQISENPGGIILDYGDNDISIDSVQEVVKNRLERQRTIDADVIILNHGEMAKALRYTKK